MNKQIYLIIGIFCLVVGLFLVAFMLFGPQGKPVNPAAFGVFIAGIGCLVRYRNEKNKA
ncbi:MAG: hypothetical protein AB1757_12805 [Acidobacteriota bacterium]